MLLIGDQQGSQRKKQVLQPAFSLYLELKMTTFFNEASAYADIKHTLRSYEALTFVRMKRSAN